MSNINDLLKIIRLTNRFGQIRRVMLISGERRHENDLEHTAQLALVAWAIALQNKIKLRQDKLIMYALVHDLVEVYAGDTFLYSKNKKEISSKEAREHKAMLRLKKEFPHLGTIHAFISNYEKRRDKESRFIYALDKILPILNIYLDGGKTWKPWKRYNISVKTIEDSKYHKVSLSPEIEPYWKDIIRLLKSKPSLFRPTSTTRARRRRKK
jgi:putative hydrolase of HD superfamily